MYDREHAPGAIKLRFHLRDKFGIDIYNSLRYDPITGQGFKRDIRPGHEGEEVEYFKPGGFVEIDGIVNPTQEQMDVIYQSVNAGLSSEVMHKTSDKLIHDSRNENT
jgi:hypothetical protein